MQVLPVLDLLRGQVVRGVGGRREDYRPLTPACRPLEVARTFRDRFGLAELYVADLDALAGGPPAWAVLDALHGDGFRLWVDAGVREADAAVALAGRGVSVVVAGLETLAGPAALAAAVNRLGDRVAFSLDLRAGLPLGNATAWGGPDPWVVAARAAAYGVSRLIVLDLARVGMDGGTGTEGLTTRLAREYPRIEVLAGGGIRGPDDLYRLRGKGVRGVLVATALHDGRITPADVAALTGPHFVRR